MEAVTTTLKSGITIRDARALSCGLQIENQNTEFFTLCYGGRDGFYLSAKGLWIKQDQIQDYRQELEIMADAMIEANQLFNRE